MLLLSTLVALLATNVATAKPVAVFVDSAGTKVFLFDDKCALEDKVTNLPYKVTWEEKGKVFEGCAGPVSWGPVVMMFFPEDKTVAVLPVSVFEKVSSL